LETAATGMDSSLKDWGETISKLFSFASKF